MRRAATLLLIVATGCVYGRGAEPEPPFDLDAEWSEGGEARAEDAREDEAPRDETPRDETPRDEARAEDAGSDEWWRVFGSPELDALERLALERALDLQAAQARVLRAHAMAQQASAARYPQISATASLSLGRSISPVGGAIDSRSASVSLPIAWEVDLFARRAGTARAAHLSAEASAADRDGVALALSAQVAEAYFDLLEVRARRLLLAEDRQADAHTAELVRLRFARGLASAVDVEQSRQQEIADDAQLSLLDGAETNARLRLATLLGVRPAELPALGGDALPEAPPALGRADVNANMLRHRPDLRAARLRVSAADSSVGAALASRLPTVQLSFTPGYSALHSESSFGASTSSGFSYNAGVGLSVPLFDGFAGRGRTNEQEANLLEAESGYERALLGALTEVDSALALDHDERNHGLELGRSVEVANNLVQAARDRFRLGLSDFLPVLSALRARTAARLAQLASRRRLLSLRVTLHRALGGALPASSTPESTR